MAAALRFFVRGEKVMLDVMRPSDREGASQQFAVVFAAIKHLITPPEPPKPRIGFKP